ncbi:MAG: hypothetical protein ACI4EA_08120 [Candidatus Ornithomonoglobus sp.]
MRIGDLKPKGSDKTLNEIFKICNQSGCKNCECHDECKIIGLGDIVTAEDMLEIEMEV